MLSISATCCVGVVTVGIIFSKFSASLSTILQMLLISTLVLVQGQTLCDVAGTAAIFYVMFQNTGDDTEF